MVPFLIILGVLAVCVFGYLQWQAKEKRRTALHTFAMQNEMTFAAKDVSGLHRRYEFNLFSEGDGRGADNVMAGQWQEMAVEAADYWYYTESTDSEGRTSRSYHRFSVVVARIDAWLPSVRAERENLFSRLADHIGFRDIEFESEEFNRSFNVKAADREFAFKLLDARMMQWLLDAPHSACVEVNGGHVLLWCKQLEAEEVPALLNGAKAFVDHVPRLVWNEYGKAAS